MKSATRLFMMRYVLLLCTLMPANIFAADYTGYGRGIDWGYSSPRWMDVGFLVVLGIILLLGLLVTLIDYIRGPKPPKPPIIKSPSPEELEYNLYRTEAGNLTTKQKCALYMEAKSFVSIPRMEIPYTLGQILWSLQDDLGLSDIEIPVTSLENSSYINILQTINYDGPFIFFVEACKQLIDYHDNEIWAWAKLSSLLRDIGYSQAQVNEIFRGNKVFRFKPNTYTPTEEIPFVREHQRLFSLFGINQNFCIYTNNSERIILRYKFHKENTYTFIIIEQISTFLKISLMYKNDRGTIITEHFRVFLCNDNLIYYTITNKVLLQKFKRYNLKSSTLPNYFENYLKFSEVATAIVQSNIDGGRWNELYDFLKDYFHDILEKEYEEVYPFIGFRRNYDNYKVEDIIHEWYGEECKGLVFSKEGAEDTYVYFSSRLGEIPISEIELMKHEFFIGVDSNDVHTLFKADFNKYHSIP